MHLLMNDVSFFVVVFTFLVWALVTGYYWLTSGGANSWLVKWAIERKFWQDVKRLDQSGVAYSSPELLYLTVWQGGLAVAAGLCFISFALLLFTYMFLIHGSFAIAAVGALLCLLLAWQVYKLISRLP